MTVMTDSVGVPYDQVKWISLKFITPNDTTNEDSMAAGHRHSWAPEPE